MKKKVCATNDAGELAKQRGFLRMFSKIAWDAWSVMARHPATPTEGCEREKG